MMLTTEQKTLVENDQVCKLFPNLVADLVIAGYAPRSLSGYESSLLREKDQNRSRIRFDKKIFFPNPGGNDDLRRAYVIVVEVFDYTAFSMPIKYGVSYKTTLNSAGPEQTDVSFGQNDYELDIGAAEDRIRRLWRGLGSPFYQG